MAAVLWNNHGYEHRSKFRKYLQQQAAGFNLQGIVHYDVTVPLSFARGIIRPAYFSALRF